MFTFLLNDDGTMELLNQYKVTEGTYQYSSMVELDDGTIGLLWENGTASIRYDNYSIKALVPEAEIGGVIERHMLSDEGAAMTGQNIGITGGL